MIFQNGIICESCITMTKCIWLLSYLYFYMTFKITLFEKVLLQGLNLCNFSQVCPCMILQNGFIWESHITMVKCSFFLSISHSGSTSIILIINSKRDSSISHNNIDNSNCIFPFQYRLIHVSTGSPYLFSIKVILKHHSPW